MMPDASPDTIVVTYDNDPSQDADHLLGLQHMAYANHKMIYADGWDRYLKDAAFATYVLGGAAAALVMAIGLWLLPDVTAEPDYMLLVPAPLAALAAGIAMWAYGRHTQNRFQSALVAWSRAFEDQHSGARTVELSPAGCRFRTDTEDVWLSWWRYHYAVAQPDHLVLIFQGTVLTIPAKLLPDAPTAIAERLNKWIEQAVTSKQGQAPSS